jgi:carbamoyltransferase
LAKELHNGNIIGYYQGKIEFGARALGNRSILGNPTISGMRDKINRVIKKREGFRPFAPMVPYNEQHKFFETKEFIPYMNQVVKVREEYINVIPSTTHIDGTARIQSVTPHNRIYNLLKEFEKLSGVPILLNTSFNIKDKTIVLTPKDAMETFLNTEMDILVMGHYLIKKVEDE